MGLEEEAEEAMEMERLKRKKKKKPNPILSFLSVLAAFLLILVGVLGPLYAFAFMSCVSTQPCYGVGGPMYLAGAYCKEDPELADMAHGDVCSLVCFESGKAPTAPELLCDDGTVIGLEGLACETVYVRDTRPPNAGLVDGAVTGGALRDVCLRAQHLTCEARLGGTATLVQYPELTSQQCDDLLEECKYYNDIFSWGEFTPTDSVVIATTDGSASAVVDIGICSLGCYLDPVGGDSASDSFISPTPAPMSGGTFGDIPESGEEETIPCELYGPACVQVEGSCNAGDNGDFYLFPGCATYMPQWVTLDMSRRIRFQDEQTLSQAGKWIMEKEANPSSDDYGTLVARQMNSFDLEPHYGTQDWTTWCETPVSPTESEVLVISVPITLGECTCTSEGDCSSNGQAVGSKAMGPNCFCECNEGWGGDNCSIPLCKSPLIRYAYNPPCAEGDWIPAGGSCTPLCEPGYLPNVDVFTCAADGSMLIPNLFECELNMADLGQVASGGIQQITTAAPYVCTNADCSFRGVATGYIFPENGRCECICNTGWTGDRCSLRVASCPAPFALDIPNSYIFPCEEGLTITTKCTAKCAEGYWPLPQELFCTGTELEPATFTCYGGTDIQEEWCNVMKNITIGTSITAFLMLAAICAMRWSAVGRTYKTFFLGEMPVDMAHDEFGRIHVIHAEGKIPESKLDGLKHSNAENLTIAAMTNFDDTTRSIQGMHKVLADIVEERRLNPALKLEEKEPFEPGVTLREMAYIKAGKDPDAPQAPNTMMEPPPLDQDGEGDGISSFLEGITPDTPTSPLSPSNWALHVATDPDMVEDPGTTYAAGPTGNTVPLQNFETAKDDLPFDPGWQQRMSELEKESLERQRQKEEYLLLEANASKAAALQRAETLLKETEAERDAIDDAIREAARRGDAEALTTAVERGRKMMKYLADCPPGPLSQLERVLLIAQGRLDAYNHIQEKKKAKFAAEDRIKRGDAPDWTMDVKGLWDRVEQLDLGGLRSGLMAKLSVMDRRPDRSTILHHACRHACREGDDTETRVTIIKELMAADAMPNIRDMEDRTPLDIAICDGGAGAEEKPVVAILRDLGFVTFAEWKAEALAQARADRNHAPAPKFQSKKAYDKMISPKDIKPVKRDKTAEQVSGVRAPTLPRR